MNELPLSENNNGKRRRSRVANIVLDVVIALLVVLIVASIAFSLTYSCVYVVGDSMYPTLVGSDSNDVSGGDFVLTKKGTPTYGDIVVIDVSDKKKYDYNIIKRVIALEGDTLYLDDGKLYVKYSGTDDFVLVDESYVSPENNTNTLRNTYPVNSDGSLDKTGHVVEDGCMFVMGDNRDVSDDSRMSFGDIPIEDTIGIVTKWSIRFKSAVTAWYTFWDFRVASIFG